MLTSIIGSILDADWAFGITHGSTETPNDVGAVAVVDGRGFHSLYMVTAI